MLVTAGQDDTVKVWDLCDGEQLGQLRGHKGQSDLSQKTVTKLTDRIRQGAASRRYVMSNRRVRW
jgi:hypothetical protein